MRWEVQMAAALLTRFPAPRAERSGRVGRYETGPRASRASTSNRTGERPAESARCSDHAREHRAVSPGLGRSAPRSPHD
jgi:hypothetical protein